MEKQNCDRTDVTPSSADLGWIWIIGFLLWVVLTGAVAVDVGERNASKWWIGLTALLGLFGAVIYLILRPNKKYNQTRVNQRAGSSFSGDTMSPGKSDTDYIERIVSWFKDATSRQGESGLSYRCKTCGQLFSNLEDADKHAEERGHETKLL